MTTHGNPRPRRSPFRAFLILFSFFLLLILGGFALRWYRAYAKNIETIERVARANRTAVFQAVSRSAAAGNPAPPIDAQGVPMARVPAGPFQMGSLNGEVEEQPVRTITLDEFYIDIFEVTNGFYQACVEAGACQPPVKPNSQRRSPYYGNPKYQDYPVVFVRYDDAASYCAWRGARLPTEAEWEKAARGGLEGADFPWGDGSPVCTPGATNGANHDRCSPAETWPVGSFAPNGYGLFDMAGNVWEWTADWYDQRYNPDAPATNPTGPETGTARVLRGGAWNLFEWHVRVATRLRYSPVDSAYNIGFRCAKSP